MSGEGLRNELQFSSPWPVRYSASNILGVSNLNQSDFYTITAIGGSGSNVWNVISSVNADIVITGNVMTIAGSSTSGTGGLAPFSEFDISSNEPIGGMIVELTNNGSGTGPVSYTHLTLPTTPYV